MTVNEFSNQFDVLYNNITSNQAPGLNEYEKSVFLTKAQDEIVKNYFNPKGNPKQEGYDDTPKRQADFSMLMKTSIQSELAEGTHFDPRSKLYNIPSDMFIMVNEQIQFVHITEGTVKGIRQVVPISFDEYTRLMSKPFKEPLKYQAWRLISSVSNSNALAEIIITSADQSKYGSSGMTISILPKYVVRYVKRPNPIRLIDFSDSYGENITIGGDATVSECELDPILHEEILQRAVELARIAWAGDTNATIQAGQRSE